MTRPATIRYPPRPASCSSEDSCCSSDLDSWAALSSARSLALAACRDVILLSEDGPPVTQSKTEDTGLVTSLAARSTGPKMPAPTPRAGEVPPSRKSIVISATAAIRRIPRTRRPRRGSCLRLLAGAAWRPPVYSAPGLGHENRTQHVEIVHALPGTQYHRVERVVGHVDGHPCLFADPLVKAAQQRSAAGQGNAPFHDVTRELRRALVQRGLHRVDDQIKGFLDGAPDLGGRNNDRLGQPADQVAPADLGVRLVG